MWKELSTCFELDRLGVQNCSNIRIGLLRRTISEAHRRCFYVTQLPDVRVAAVKALARNFKQKHVGSRGRRHGRGRCHRCPHVPHTVVFQNSKEGVEASGMTEAVVLAEEIDHVL